MDKKKSGLDKKKIKNYILYGSFTLFIIVSLIFNYSFGERVYNNFYKFSLSMISMVPAVFILIGIFEVWVKREMIVKHMGKDSGIRGYFWALVLSGTAVGGLYVAFPIGYALQKKGARLSVIFTYFGAVSVARVPMTLYEASYMGMKFTIIRLLVSLPLIIISAILLEKFLEKSDYMLKSIEK